MSTYDGAYTNTKVASSEGNRICSCKEDKRINPFCYYHGSKELVRQSIEEDKRRLQND